MKKFFSLVWQWIKDFVKKNTGLKILSLVLAFVIWCLIIAGSNPIRVKTIDDVPLRVEGTEELTAKGLCIDSNLSEIPETIKMTVEAGLDYHNSITKTSATATLNLNSINEAGEYDMNMITYPGASGAKVANTNPSTIKLYVDELATRTVPVSVKIVSQPKEGYVVTGVSLRDKEITVKGPKQRIDSVRSAVVYVDAYNMTQSDSFSSEVVLIDKDGDELKSVEVTEHNIYSIVDIEIYPTKTIALSYADLKDSILNIKDGYETYGAVFTPAQVTIAGERSVINNISSLDFEIVDAMGAETSIVLDFKLKPIDGVVFIEGDTVKGYLQIREINETLSYSHIPIEVRNLPAGYTYKFDDTGVGEVTITAPRSVVGSIGRNDIKLYVDASSLKEGKSLNTVYMDEISGISSGNVKLSVTEVYLTVEKSNA